MKIALCLEYPIAERGGVSVLVETLARGLASHHTLVLISPDTEEAVAKSAAAGCFQEHVAWASKEYPPRTARALARRIAATGAQLAHFHFGANFSWGNRFPRHCPIPYLREGGVPVLTTVHMTVGLFHGYCGPQRPSWFKLAMLPIAWLGKMHALRSVEREVAVSQHDCARLRCWYWPARKKFVPIYHSRLEPDAVPAVEANRESIILNVGHVAERKGQPVLAEAFARIARQYPKWELQFAGHVAEDECRRRIERSATACASPNQICLLGRREDAAELMQRAAVYVQPSFHEGLPLALQEAMFYGCACVATHIPGNTEIVGHDVNGLLVAVGNVEQLAQALDRLLPNASLRQKLSAGGRQAIVRKEMTAPKMIEKHLRLYESIRTEFCRSNSQSHVC